MLPVLPLFCKTAVSAAARAGADHPQPGEGQQGESAPSGSE